MTEAMCVMCARSLSFICLVHVQCGVTWPIVLPYMTVSRLCCRSAGAEFDAEMDAELDAEAEAIMDGASASVGGVGNTAEAQHRSPAFCRSNTLGSSQLR